jgi:microcystin-dependent protein
VHTHGVTDPQHTHGPPAGTSAYVAQGGGTVPSGSGFNWSTPANTGAAATGITIDNAGSGSAHNNMQPFQVVNKIIRAK